MALPVRSSDRAFGLTRSCVEADYRLTLICIDDADDPASSRSSFCVATARYAAATGPNGKTGSSQAVGRAPLCSCRHTVGPSPEKRSWKWSLAALCSTQEDPMRVNTKESIKLGERIHGRFGSWEAARKASRLRDGVYLVPADAEKQESKRQTAPTA
jgi:hypothetical protein